MNQFIDNQDGTITDSKTGLIWTRDDSWLKDQKWVTWDEAKEYAFHINDLKLGERNNWRLPTIEEIKSLVTEEPTNLDHYGKNIRLPKEFPKGSLPNLWIHEGPTGNEGFFLDLKSGEVGKKFKSIAGRMAARCVSNTF